MHRLIPSRYSDSGTVLSGLADDDEMLAKLIRLDGATNDRIQGEQSGLIGISTYELVYGIPNAHIIRAAYLHPSPTGSRFNDSTRGAWYAADKLETSLDEVGYH
ncbi:RES family NAD+ phosphorylase, partial [Terriglobus sp. YAF25]